MNPPSITAWIDGSCNPNPAGWIKCGILVKLDGTTVHESTVDLGYDLYHTNNVAEFSALLYLLRWYDMREPMTIHTDSSLVYHVMTRKWKPKTGTKYRVVYEQIRKVMDQKGLHNILKFVLVPREKNTEADRLSKL